MSSSQTSTKAVSPVPLGRLVAYAECRTGESICGEGADLLTLHEDPESELEALIASAEDAEIDLLDRYETVESQYRDATSVTEVSMELSTTTGLPVSVNVTASSAR